MSGSSRNAAAVRQDQADDQGRNRGDCDIDDQRAEPDIERIAGAVEADGRKRLQTVVPRRPRAPADTDGPAEQQALGAEPARKTGNRIAFLRIVSSDFDPNTPVSVCGYMKAANAEPSAKVA